MQKEGVILKEFITKKRLVIDTVAQKIGVTRRTLYNIFEEERISRKHLELLSKEIGFKVDDCEIYYTPTPNAPNVFVLDIVALANPDGVSSQLSELPDKVIYLPNLPKGHTYYAVGIQGDSMQPYYTDTDKIIVREVALSALVNDRIYLLIVDGSPMLKRYRRVLSGAAANCAELISENATRYAPYLVDTKHITKAFEVMLKISEPL